MDTITSTMAKQKKEPPRLDRGTVQMNPQEFQAYWKKQQDAKQSKFKAVPMVDHKGEKFRSHLEGKYHERMTLLMRVGEVAKVEREIPYQLVVNGVLVATYVLDFRVTYPDGRIEYVDCKSSATVTALFKIKKALMLAIYNIDVVEVFE